MKRSPKRKLNGIKMRRLQLYILPEVFEDLEKIAGPLAYNVTVEELIRREKLRRIRRLEKTQSGAIPL